MSLLGELKQLQELPPPVLPPLWPQTWGWLLLLTLLLLGFGAALLLWRRKRRSNAYRREALLQLDKLVRHWQQQPEDYARLRDVPELLKRAALSRLDANATAVARLSGAEWQRLLASMARAPLVDNLGQNLAQLAYAPDSQLSAMDIAGLLAECRCWLETHDDPA